MQGKIQNVEYKRKKLAELSRTIYMLCKDAPKGTGIAVCTLPPSHTFPVSPTFPAISLVFPSFPVLPRRVNGFLSPTSPYLTHSPYPLLSPLYHLCTPSPLLLHRRVNELLSPTSPYLTHSPYPLHPLPHTFPISPSSPYHTHFPNDRIPYIP